MSVDSQKLEQLFSHAISLPVERREQFVGEACANDELLKNEFNELLAAHLRNETSGFLEQPPAPFTDLESHIAEIAEQEGDTIGRYRLLEKIGEGGMGVVYMAEQTEGVRRRVALKIIKLGMDTRRVIARFEVERQAMAMFDHPNITRVFDAGATSTGRPYFVMELVRGTGITNYVRNHNISISEKLRLFVDVCNATQHAHQKGIIHRDLKPSNILVTLYDGVPVVKVIDFGIAKAIGPQRLTDKTLFTRYSAMVGTPEYMSPEQAEMNGLDVDTRSDIYSLGVLLYELVTNTTPHSAEELSQVNPLALFETLRDVEIETPSSRLARTQRETENTKTASTRDSNAQIERFQPKAIERKAPERVKGELDWVVMKALSRDRTRRYASANEMANDVIRFLNGDPVLAAPPSWSYQLKSLFRKYKTAAITTAVVSSLILSAAIACFAMAINLQKVNQNVVKTNSELKRYVEQLEVAEQKVREASEHQQYASAIKLALLKFEMEFEEHQFRLAEKMFPEAFLDQDNSDQMLPELQATNTEDSEQIENILTDEPLETFGTAAFMISPELCFTFEKTKLIELKEPELLAKTLSRIKGTIEERENFLNRLYHDETVREEDHTHDHSESCLKHQAASNQLVGDFRPVFYRYLTNEYRKTFGANDPRIAGALNALASSLIESGKFDEAESRLRESLAIAESTDANSAKTLMKKLATARIHVPAQKKNGRKPASKTLR